jgi:hypothetical protein
MVFVPAEQGGEEEWKRRRRGVNWKTPTRLHRIKSTGPSIQSIQWRSQPASQYFLLYFLSISLIFIFLLSFFN